MSNFQDLDKLLGQFVQDGLAGCACAVARDGEILYEGYNGMADREAGRPMDAETIFRLFSMTKVIVCTAGMMLFERGKFLLNDPLYEYLPAYRHHTVVKTAPSGNREYVESTTPMLVKHAFSMSVGLPYAFGDNPTANAMRKVKEDLTAKYGKYDLQTEVKAMAEVPLAFEPGTRWLYGYGHELVAALAEVVSGKSIGQFIRDEITEPLGMKDTAYRFFGNARERMAVLYRRADDGTLTPDSGMLDDLHEPDALLENGGAGLFATLRDYLAFAQMMACGGRYKGQQIIGRKTIDLMRRNQLTEQQMSDFGGTYNAGYGYGLGVRTMMDPAVGGCNGSIGEFGWTGAAGTWTAIDPSEKVAMVYMHQMMPNQEEYHHLRVRAAAFGSL